MAQKPSDEDLMVAKLAAMEIVMLTLIRPMAGNQRFWADVDAIAQAFQSGNQDVLVAFPQRWEATQSFLQEWRRAWNQAG